MAEEKIYKRLKIKDMEVTVEVELDDFDIDDIIEHIEDNGYKVVGKKTSSEERAVNVRDITKMCENLSSCGYGFYRELLTDILFIPSNSSDERILEGVKELLKR